MEKYAYFGCNDTNYLYYIVGKRKMCIKYDSNNNVNTNQQKYRFKMIGGNWRGKPFGP